MLRIEIQTQLIEILIDKEQWIFPTDDNMKNAKCEVIAFHKYANKVIFSENNIFYINDFATCEFLNNLNFTISFAKQADINRVLIFQKIFRFGKIELTYNCNHKCVHCYCPDQISYHVQSVSAHKADELDRLIERLKILNIAELTLTGGSLFYIQKDGFLQKN